MKSIIGMFIFAGFLLAQSPFKTKIKFSGMEWGVFTNYDRFSESQFTKDAVYVDSLGYLHLRAYARKTDSGLKFFASGVISRSTHLYGVYRFETIGTLDSFYNTDFGPFLYDWNQGIYEIDLEYYKKGDPLHNPGNFNVHYMPPGKHYKKHFDFPLPRGKVHAFHYIYLYPDSIVMKVAVLEHGKEKVYGYHVFKDKRFIPKRPVYIEMYLWWLKRAITHGKEREIVIKSVKFTPFDLKNKESQPPKGPAKLCTDNKIPERRNTEK